MGWLRYDIKASWHTCQMKTLDSITDGQMSAKWWGGDLSKSESSWRVRAKWSSATWGQAPGPQSLQNKTGYWQALVQWCAVRAAGSPSQLSPWPHMHLWLLQMEHWWQVTDRDPLGWALLPHVWLLWGLLGDGLHWPWWSYFHPFGWHHGHKDISFCKSGKQLHCLPEFLCTPHQAVRLPRDWGMHLLSPVLQSLCIGDGMLQVGKNRCPGCQTLHILWVAENGAFQTRGVLPAVCGSCSTFFAWLHALGTSKEACTFQANSL